MSELDKQMLGNNVIVDRLEILFIHVLRIYITFYAPQEGLIAALGNPKIYRALEQIHKSPQTDWSLKKLAQHAGMSRASFASHFKKLLGLSPMQYLTTIRMQQAQDILKTSNKPLNVVAEDVGYGSEIAFNRAFRRFSGQAPGRFRRNN